jgi:hypothetical protein
VDREGLGSEHGEGSFVEGFHDALEVGFEQCEQVVVRDVAGVDDEEPVGCALE